MDVVVDVLHGIFLGVIQGIGEFLPISSSGHLVLLPYVLGWEYQGVGYDVMLHLGTLVALILYFRRDVIELAKAGLYSIADYRGGMKPYRVLLSRILIGTVPAVVAALLFEDLLTQTARHPVIAGIALIAMGLVLWVGDRSVAKREQHGGRGGGGSLALMTWWHALVIGCFQALALIPGVSRSGSTIAGSLLVGYNRKDAARFSFLLSIPVIIGAFVFSVADFWKDGRLSVGMIVGALAAGVTGYFAISFLLKYVENRSFLPFVIYRILLGVGILVWWFVQ